MYQPDERIGIEDLGVAIINGKRYVINARRGVPHNACIEQDPRGALRCWASYQFLTDEAADFVRRSSAYLSEQNAFVWNREIRVDKVRRAG